MEMSNFPDIVKAPVTFFANSTGTSFTLFEHPDKNRIICKFNDAPVLMSAVTHVCLNSK